ncbi:hypothetical protein K4K53_009001 [Colletotrichum sp. SAR 10_77]|nr:hypothetical protein K4K53_009001 [Colletotrichum sp. SAR 10_77]
MSSSQPNPDSGEKPTKNDNRAENWTPKDAADGCVTRKIWVAIYTKTFEEFLSPEIQMMWKGGIRKAYEWIHANKDDTWVPRRYVAHEALKVCAFSLNVYDEKTWPEEFVPWIIRKEEMADLDDGYREFLESKKAAPTPMPGQENVSREKDSVTAKEEDSEATQRKGKGKAVSENDSSPKDKTGLTLEIESKPEDESKLEKCTESESETKPDASHVTSAPEVTMPVSHLQQKPIEWAKLTRKKGCSNFRMPAEIAKAIDRGRMEREKIFEKSFLLRDKRGLVGEGFAVPVPPDVQQESLFRNSEQMYLANLYLNQMLQVAWLDYEGTTYLLCFQKNPGGSLMSLLEDYTKAWIGLKQYCRHLTIEPPNQHLMLNQWLDDHSKNHNLSDLAIWGIYLHRQQKVDEAWLAESPETRHHILDTQKLLSEITRFLVNHTDGGVNEREAQLDMLLWNGPHTQDRSLTFRQAISPISDAYATCGGTLTGRVQAASAWMDKKYKQKSDHLEKFAPDNSDPAHSFIKSCQAAIDQIHCNHPLSINPRPLAESSLGVLRGSLD